jgi:hypothetical protein
MILSLNKYLSSVSLKSVNGRFLSDKSYKYDTLFFMASFIIRFMNQDYTFSFNKHKEKINLFISDIFNLRDDASGNINFFHESISLFKFANIISDVEPGTIKINNIDFLRFISASIENSYIFQYLLTYNVYKNHNILSLYKEYLSDDINKIDKLLKIKERISEESISIKEKNTIWESNYVKFSIMVLSLANKDNRITRTLNILNTITTPEDLAANKSGTKTPEDKPKNNNYIKNFNLDYVIESLNSFLVSNVVFKKELSKLKINSEANDISNLKLDIISMKENPKNAEEELFINEQIRTRNSKLQRQFRDKLLTNLVNKCVVCELAIKDLLVAAHIVPYSKCDLIYDATNDKNGLLLCPIHDKLFESGKYMTIDFKSGEIILSSLIKNEIYFESLLGKKIDSSLINSERRHYLKWHNDEFFKKNKSFT